jgi:hypothetical protein
VKIVNIELDPIYYYLRLIIEIVYLDNGTSKLSFEFQDEDFSLTDRALHSALFVHFIKYLPSFSFCYIGDEKDMEGNCKPTCTIGNLNGDYREVNVEKCWINFPRFVDEAGVKDSLKSVIIPSLSIFISNLNK